MNFWFWFILLLLLVLITIVGHGIWVLLQKAVGALSHSGQDKETFRAKCSVCGSNIPLSSNYCGFCGSKQTAHGQIPADLDFILRQLNRLVSLKRIDQSTYQTIIKAIEADRARFPAPPAAQKPAEPIISPPELDLPDSPVAPESFTPPLPQEQATQERRDRGKAFQEMAVRELIQEKAPEREDARPPRTFAEVLATFMEERSIQWGEVIGGLLIIGCSIALVVSLWAQITLFPFRRFLVFTGMTAGLFGLGLYSAHRWKLPTTSVGVLIIATLLVPLNFLGISAFPLQTRLASILIELAALALFSFLVYQAGRVILPRCEWLLVCAVLGPSFAMLLAQHWTAEAELQSMLLGLLPLIFYWGSTGALLRRSQSDAGLRPAHHFILLGLASYAASLPFALLIFNNAGYTAALYAPIVTFFGVPAIVTGIANWRKPAAELSGGMRTLATAVTFIGALASLSALPVAWPVPVSLLFVALINCGICLALAFVFKPLKLLHLIALAHLLLAYLIAVNLAAKKIFLWAEDAPALLGSLAAPLSARSLALFFLLLALAAEALRTRAQKKSGTKEGKAGAGQPEEGKWVPALADYYAIAAAVIGILSLALLTIHGFGRPGDPQLAAPFYAFYAGAALIMAWRRKAMFAAWIGCGLALLAVFQALACASADVLSPYHPGRLSLLVSATVAALAAILLQGEEAQKLFRRPLTATGLFAAGLAAAGVLFGGWLTKPEISAGLLWLALVWALLACFYRWRWLFSVFQAALTLSVVFATEAMVEGRFSRAAALDPFDPMMLQAQGIALALLSFAWVLVRLLLRNGGSKDGSKSEADRGDTSAAAKLLNPPWPAVDQITIAIVLLLLLVLSADSLSLLPGRNVAREAAGSGSWFLALVLALVLITGLWVRFSQLAVLGLLFITSAVVMLLAGAAGAAGAAGSWYQRGSAEMAYYWLASFGFLIVSLPLLFRNQVSRLCESIGWPEMQERAAGLAKAARISAILLFVAPIMLTYPLLFFAAIVKGASNFTEIGKLIPLVIPPVMVGLAFAGHALRERSTGYAVTASMMINLAVTMGILQGNNEPGWLMPVVHWNLLTTSLTSLAWLAALRLGLDAEAYRKGSFGRPPHQLLATLSLSLGVAAFIGHLNTIVFSPGSLGGTAWSGWASLASLLLLLIASLWERANKYAIPGLLLSGFFVILLLLIDLDGVYLAISASSLLAAYGIALGVLWRKRERLLVVADALNLPAGDSARIRSWLLLANQLITAAVIVISLIGVFSFESLPQRLIVAVTALTLPLSNILLGAGEQNKTQIGIALNLGLLSVLIWSWAWIEPGTGVRNYLIGIVAITSAVVIGIKLWAWRFKSVAGEWRDILRPEVPALIGIGLSSLALLFVIDLWDFYDLGQVMMGGAAVWIVLAILMVMALSSIALALLPGDDPLGLDKPGREQKKMGYVYAAEAFIVLAVMHARFTMPWLFGHLFQPFWPLIVMALAFAGVALGEIFRKKGREVLAEPLGRTGFILPLFPVLGFWLSDSRVPFSGLLLLVGLFYAILSVMRRSFLIGLLAVAAGNGGLWHFLNGRDGFGFDQHPQLWAIPVALSVLAAARVNRDNLSREQLTGIRYASLLAIYLSSTAEIFIHGVSDSPWLSVILAVISVTGVIAGLILRVRAFLYLGTGFLLLAVSTMIWTALISIGRDWVWYATGIAIGILIIYAAVTFEKKRTRMLNLLDQMKEWKA